MNADVLAHDIEVDRNKLELLYERQKAATDADTRKAIGRQIAKREERIERNQALLKATT